MDFDLVIFAKVLANEGIQPDAGLDLIDAGESRICASYNNYEGSLEEVIFEFLRKVESNNREMFSLKTVLQMGVYYSPEEAVVLNLKLSDHCLSELNRKLVDLDICEYLLCAE